MIVVAVAIAAAIATERHNDITTMTMIINHVVHHATVQEEDEQ